MGNLILNKMCVNECFVDVFYILKNYVKDIFNKECLKCCNDFDYLFNFICMEICLKGFFGYKN